MKYLLTTTFILLFAFTVSAQTDGDKLKQCTQFLNKSMQETSACQDTKKAQAETIKAQKATIELLKKQIELERKWAERYIKRQDETIKRLEIIKCSKTYYLFGLIKTKKCF